MSLLNGMPAAPNVAATATQTTTAMPSARNNRSADGLTRDAGDLSPAARAALFIRGIPEAFRQWLRLAAARPRDPDKTKPPNHARPTPCAVQNQACKDRRVSPAHDWRRQVSS